MRQGDRRPNVAPIPLSRSIVTSRVASRHTGRSGNHRSSLHAVEVAIRAGRRRRVMKLLDTLPAPHRTASHHIAQTDRALTIAPSYRTLYDNRRGRERSQIPISCFRLRGCVIRRANLVLQNPHYLTHRH